MFRITGGRIYIEDIPFPASNGLWMAKAYKQTRRWEDLVIDVFARSMSYAGEKEEFLCNIIIDRRRLTIGDHDGFWEDDGDDGESEEESEEDGGEFTVTLDNGIYPIYGAKNEIGELVQVRIDTY